ncbi:MAG TPA: BTAD domain-containing putative transcriptional regulator [Trebonia sp.]|nr:BTAD domain-containing putative transcriptional regulator [Trebonia sp.]
MRVWLLGELEAEQGGVPVPVRGTKQRALLALLALRPGQPVSADRLIDVLWGDGQAAHPGNALQAQIGQLRRTLGSAAILTTEAGYALDVGPDEVDAVRFGRLVAEGRRLAADGEMVLASAALGEALRLRRGEPLAEFAYAGFFDAERARLDELTLVAVESKGEADLVLGRHGELTAELDVLCREHPLRERLWELLILALYQGGRQAEALRAYAEVRDRLAGELGIDPGPALRQLQARILAQDPSLAPASAAIAADPVRAAAPPKAAGNLREPLSSFVGRDAELEQLREALGRSRLVTLTGPGGVGKTRLAVAAAAALRDEHRDGAWLVELASVAQAGEVAPATASALEASALAGPQPAGSTTQLIVRHLAGRSLIVVLDNCEHVIGEASALANTLVGAVPGLRLIATSREPLGIPGEVLLPVGGLAPSAAVALFADRARAVRPGFPADGRAGDVIEDICRRLDGLPLAVELAAARLRALPLATLAERLGDRFRLLTGGARTALPRQQTLRAVVDWSYDLLFEDERRLFARLAVFTGGCGLTAAEAVCADEHMPAGEILDVLSRLVGKSLVTVSGTDAEARFSQLQTLWQYARERLAESGEGDAMRARHGAHYLQMAKDAYLGLRGATGPIWRDRLTAELGNLRAALDWYVATGDADAAVSLASGMAWLWYINGDFAEGARWLGDALGANGTCRPGLSATAHVWHGFFVCMSSSPATGIIECEAAVAAARISHDRVRLAEALVVCAAVLVRAHEFGRSLDALAEARDLLEASGHGWLLAGHDMVLAWTLVSLGQLGDAEAAARSSVEGFDAQGEAWLVISPLSTLAGIAEVRGDRDGASAAYESLLERCRSAGPRIYVPESLARLAALRAGQGDNAAADRLYADAIACSFNPWLSADAMVGQAAVARRLGDLPRARALLDAAGAHYRQVDLPSGQPRVLAGLAWCALAAGHLADAAVFAADAARGASASGDPAAQLLADTAVAAVKAIADPTRHNVEAFGALARRRAQEPAYRSLTDGPDVTALAARLTLAAG